MPPLYEGRRGSRLQREKMEPGGSETGLAPAVGGGCCVSPQGALRRQGTTLCYRRAGVAGMGDTGKCNCDAQAAPGLEQLGMKVRVLAGPSLRQTSWLYRMSVLYALPIIGLYLQI